MFIPTPLKDEPSQFDHQPRRIAILTGLSDWNSCQLSDPQIKFLKDIPIPEEQKIFQNFPYTNKSTMQKVGLIKASLANVWQFLFSWTKSYQSQAIKHLDRLLASSDEVILIVGSCGAEILNNMLKKIDQSSRIKVITYGAVARRFQRSDCIHVQGENDLLSAAFLKDPDYIIPEVGHMNYMQSPVFKSIVKRFVCGSISKSQA